MINKLSTFIPSTDHMYSNGIHRMNSIFSADNINFDIKIAANRYSFYNNDFKLLFKDQFMDNISSADLLILSEPGNRELKEENLRECIDDYWKAVKEARENNIKIVHLIGNETWFELFIDIINSNDIPVYGFESNNKLTNQVKIIKPFLKPNDFIHYTNNINNDLLIDLTLAYDNEKQYKLNLKKLLLSANETFNNVTILINNESYIADINNDKVKIMKEKEFSQHSFEHYTYVYLYTNSPYGLENIDKYIFYAANSKVLFSNYNYYINNMLPSVILNMSTNKYNFFRFSEMEAFNIINENRNTVLYKHTLVNILDEICNDTVGINIIQKHNISSSLEHFDPNLYFDTENVDDSIHIDLNNYRYDLENTLLFPILFLGESATSYGESECYLGKRNINNSLDISILTNMSIDESNKKFSMIIPIHNNGRYLKYKCFNSILKLSCLRGIEIIFIDDGSTNNETLRIIKDILLNYPSILFRRFEEGSGSASRPRNEGVKLSNTNYITFLDPDNEVIEDGYTYLIDEILDDDNLDMVVGNIIREDNVKRNEISYSRKLNKVQKSNYVTNTKETLVNLNLSVQSIQALMVKKDIIMDNGIQMVEGAAGQDTLYFQELMINCSSVKVINHNIHSYYAYVEGSVTNTVTSKFFEKFYKVEIERKRFLEENNLINYYMENRFNLYVTNWYIKKLKQVTVEEQQSSLNYIKSIIALYSDYESFFSDEIIYFQHND